MITDISMKELVLDCPQLSELNMTGCEKMTATSVQFALQNFHHLNSLCLAAFSGLSPIPFPRFPYLAHANHNSRSVVCRFDE